jgi:hypothetical protein
MHTLVAEASIVTLTGSIGFTTIVIAFDVAGLPDSQTALEVNTQVTTSPSAGTNENVESPPDPAVSITTPFTNH